jgi:Transposase DDE domain
MNRLSRRPFRKAHLAVEARAEDRAIYAWRLTTSRRHDGPLLPKLLEQIEGPIGDVLGDGAYASRSNAEYVEGRGGVSYLRPRENWRPRAGAALALAAPPSALPRATGMVRPVLSVPGERRRPVLLDEATAGSALASPDDDQSAARARLEVRRPEPRALREITRQSGSGANFVTEQRSSKRTLDLRLVPPRSSDLNPYAWLGTGEGASWAQLVLLLLPSAEALYGSDRLNKNESGYRRIGRPTAGPKSRTLVRSRSACDSFRYRLIYPTQGGRAAPESKLVPRESLPSAADPGVPRYYPELRKRIISLSREPRSGWGSRVCDRP